MITRRWVRVLVLCLCLNAIVVGLWEGAARGERSRSLLSAEATKPLVRQQELSAVRVKATVYQVVVPDEKVSELDSHSLASGGKTLAMMRTALAALGQTKVLHHIDQSVELGREHRLSTESRLPIVNSIARGKNDVVTVNYSNPMILGATFHVFGVWNNDVRGGSVETKFAVDLRGSRELEIQLFEQKKVVNYDIHSCNLSHAGFVRPGEPAVLLTVVGDARKSGNAFVYVVRLVLSTPGR